MGLTHNASTPADNNDIIALKIIWGEEFIDAHEIEVKFTAKYVTVNFPASRLKRRVSRARWVEWAEAGFPVTVDEFPLPAPAGSSAASAQVASEPVPAPVESVTPREKKAPVVEPSDDYLSLLAHRTLEIAMEERAGDTGKNAARFKRGDLMIDVADIARATGEKIKVVLADLNDRTLELAESNAIIGYEPVTEQEAARTRKVVEAFGSSGNFRLVNAISRVTGEPVVLDDGNPPTMNLTDVALNKLVPLTRLANEDQDEVLSFAYRNTEKVVTKAASVSRRSGKPLIDVIRHLNDARTASTHPVTGDLIQVQPEGREALDVLGAMVGEDPTPDIVNIKTSRGFYETFWEPLKRLMSAVASEFNPSMVAADPDGLVSNVFVFEQTIAQYFSIYEDPGVKSALGAMVKSETITQAQAEAFLASYAYDPSSGEWLQVVDMPDPEPESVVEADDDWDDADDVDDDDWDDDDDWEEDDWDEE